MLEKLNSDFLQKIKPLLIVGAHVFCLILVFHFLSFQDFFKGIGSFKQWDAFWYEKIAVNGYEYSYTEPSNSGFFPMFSYIWKYSGLSTIGISLLNFILFIAGMLFIKKAVNLTNSMFLLALSVPSMMFMYVPYTEAIFFFSSSLFLYGISTNKNAAIYCGLLIASLTRPTAIFFIPSILFMELMINKNKKVALLNSIKYASFSILGVFIVILIQYIKTGVLFAYFKAQNNFWKREFQLPEIPFTTWDGTRLLWLDGIALIFGITSAILVFYFTFIKIRGNKELVIGKSTLFSLSYLMLAVLSVIFFNGKDAKGGTSLMGANRYLMATPFFVCFLASVSKNIFKEKALIISTLFSLIIVALMIGLGKIIGNFDHAYSNRYVLFTCLYASFYFAIGFKNSKAFIYVLYTINIFAQIILISYFSNGFWVG